MNQTSEARESWKTPDEMLPTAAAHLSGDLLQSVLQETEAAWELLQHSDAPDDVDLAVFVSTARRLKQRQASPDEAIRELVRLAIPDWLARLFCSAAAWEAACTAVAYRLAEDAMARQRVLSLWERMAGADGHEEEH